jgi:hypothetical protein
VIETILGIVTGGWSGILPWVIGLVAAIAGAFGLRRSGVKAERNRNIIKTMKANEEKHERINDADTGIGATDGERVGRLRRLADDLKRG